MLGIASAMWEGHSPDLTLGLLVLAGALAAHISVNALNEYWDFKSGLDLRTIKTPFSGGSGTLVANPSAAPAALAIGVGTLLFTVALGLHFINQYGWGLLPVGLAGVAIIAAYTPWINRNRYICLVAPGLGFGPLMVMGSHYVVSGTYSPTALAASLVPFFLVSNLLLLNQLPDIEADRSVGRDNFFIATGPEGGLRIYGLFAILAFASNIGGVLTGLLPAATLAALPTAFLAWHAWQGMGRALGDIPAMTPFLRSNVILSLAAPLLVAVGLILA